MREGNAEPVRPLSVLQESLERELTGDRVTIRALLCTLGRKSTELVLMLLSLPAIVPTPGIPAGLIFGTALSLVALQILIKAKRVSLPHPIERLEFSRSRLLDIVTRANGKMAFVERRLRERWLSFLSPTSVKALALLLVLMGVLIALPIPFGNVLPGIASLLVALGLMSRDGLVVAVGVGFGFLALSTFLVLVVGSWRLLT
jgi:hypothetical protein